jgi:hypothetical protein
MSVDLLKQALAKTAEALPDNENRSTPARTR